MNLPYFADPNAKEDVVEIAIPEERRDEYKSARENNDLYAMCTNKIRIPCMSVVWFSLSGIPRNYTKEDVAEICKSVLGVTDIKIVTPSQENRALPFAIVTFETEQQAKNALRQFEDLEIASKRSHVTFFYEKKSMMKKPGSFANGGRRDRESFQNRNRNNAQQRNRSRSRSGSKG